MKKLFNQYEVLVSNLKSNPFAIARLKLTFFYIFVSGILIFSFSFFTYQTFKFNLETEVKDEYTSTYLQNNAVEHTSDQTRNTIIFVDTFVLILVGVLSYVLAGKTLKPIKNIMESQKVFISDASHELRTPLAIMKSTLEVEIRKDNNSKKDKYISLEEEVDRMTGIVENLLKISRMENNQSLKLEDIKLSELIDHSISLLSDYSSKKRINISFNGEETKDLSIKGDNQQLLQVFLNIIKNAIDYSSQDSEVKIDVSLNKGYVNVNISDYGIGISEKDINHVFERFYRADSSRSRNTGGNGLGLSIAKKIISIHGGDIRIISELSKGSTFTIILPIST